MEPAKKKKKKTKCSLQHFIKKEKEKEKRTHKTFVENKRGLGICLIQ